MDEFDSQNEATAYQQQAMDLLYRLGCEYDIKTSDMQELCSLALVPFEQFKKYEGVQA